MNQEIKKRLKYIIPGAIILVLALLWFYQQQGYIKIFPTSDDFEIRRLTTIDESNFSRAEGLTDEQYEEKLRQLEETRQAVLDNPESSIAWFNYGSVLDFLNDHEKATGAWKKTLEYQPQHFVAAHNIGTNYQYFIKDFPEAEQYYLQALFGNPAYAPSYQGLIDLYRYNYLEKRDSLEPLLLRAIGSDSGNAAYYYGLLVEDMIEQGDLEAAREYLDALGQISSESAQKLVEKYPELR